MCTLEKFLFGRWLNDWVLWFRGTTDAFADVENIIVFDSKKTNVTLLERCESRFLSLCLSRCLWGDRVVTESSLFLCMENKSWFGRELFAAIGIEGEVFGTVSMKPVPNLKSNVSLIIPGARAHPG